jgi:hypothetical protein
MLNRIVDGCKRGGRGPGTRGGGTGARGPPAMAQGAPGERAARCRCGPQVPRQGAGRGRGARGLPAEGPPGRGSGERCGPGDLQRRGGDRGGECRGATGRAWAAGDPGPGACLQTWEPVGLVCLQPRAWEPGRAGGRVHRTNYCLKYHAGGRVLPMRGRCR